MHYQPWNSGAPPGNERTGRPGQAAGPESSKSSGPTDDRGQHTVNGPRVDNDRETRAAELNGHAALEKFWNSRPELRHIRQHARSRLAAPLAVLGVVLVRAIMTVPPNVVLPPIIGGPVAPNLFCALVGGSGNGKNAVTSAARSAFLLPPGCSFPEAPLGSGEGVTKSFAHADKNGPGGIMWDHHAVLFTCGEVDTLDALRKRSGSTLEGELRKLYMGESVGFSYATTDKRVVLPDLSYRAGLIMGVQPERAAAVLGKEQQHGGTPQRLMWIPTAIDPEEPDTPEPKRLPDLHWIGVGTRLDEHGLAPPEEIYVPDTIREQIRADYRARNAPGAVCDPLDAHAGLTRLKAAFGFGVLAGRKYPTEDDWRMAGEFMAVSDATRAGILKTLQVIGREDNVGRGWAEGQRAVAAKEVIERDAVNKARRTITAKIRASKDITHGTLIAALTRSAREVAPEVLASLVANGQIRKYGGDVAHGGQEKRTATRYAWLG